jgi:hypothetical protein
MIATAPDISLLTDNLKNPLWRLNNLYWIINENGQRVKFNMRPVQQSFWDNIWFWNIILKSRQHGLTTEIDLIGLDLALWNDNIEAAIIAHTLRDVQHIFATKIKYPYDNLPEQIKSRIPALKDDGSTLHLANNSWVRVALSMRSSTLNFLHVSEHGKICAKYPQKAEELKTGTLPALHEGSYLFIESTAEGGAGDFYDTCTTAQGDTAREKQGIKLNKQQCRFHFFAWYQDPKNQCEPVGIIISDELIRYFDEIKAKHGIELSDRQKSWYALKKDGPMGLGNKMKREHPSTPEEAFEQSVEGAIYTDEMCKIRSDGRIRFEPHRTGHKVFTFWDIGIGNSTAIVFAQFIGKEIPIIDYIEGSGRGSDYYAKVLSDKSYVYGKHYLPHDVMSREKSDGIVLLDKIENLLGANKVEKVNRPASKQDGIEAVRLILGHCSFDTAKTKRLIECLSYYRYEWDDTLARFGDKPLHDWASDGADAMQTMALQWALNGIDINEGEAEKAEDVVFDGREDSEAREGYGLSLSRL